MRMGTKNGLLVMDNLNTHGVISLYETFEPKEDMKTEVATWEQDRNNSSKKINWQFTQVTGPRAGSQTIPLDESPGDRVSGKRPPVNFLPADS